MRRFAALCIATLVAVGVTQSVAQGAPEIPAAKGKVTINVPKDGDATVAHVVLNGQTKKGKKPKAPVRRPKLKVLKAPTGVVVAASYKRDEKKKNRWHATVVVTNPRGGPVLRSASSPAQSLVVVIAAVDTDGTYVIIIGSADVIDEIVFDQPRTEEALAGRWIAPPGSSGDAFLFGMAPGVSANDFLLYSRMLAADGPITAEDFGELDLGGVVLICSPFPGNPREAFCDFTIFDDGYGVNGIAIQFPGANVVTQLAPAGFSGVVTSSTVTWGSAFMPFQAGKTYRGDVRLNMPFSADTDIRARTTTTGGPPYSAPYPGNFVP